MKISLKLIAAVFSAIIIAGVWGGAVKAAKQKAPVSPALSVISNEVEMIKTGYKGKELSFSPSDFEAALGREKIESIEILSLPSAVSGKLMLGSLEVMKNQKISRANISALKFIPSGNEASECYFEFRADGESYLSVVCSLYLLEKENFAPTVSGIDEGEFNISTYKNIAYFGKMPISDPEDDSVRYEIASYPKRGIIAVSDRENGNFVYTPTKNYTGKDSFTYTVTDKYGNSTDEITINIQVTRSENGTVFEDLIGKSSHNSAILLSDLGIMTGKTYEDRCFFEPDGKVTREEFLVLAMKAVGEDVGDISVGAVSIFSDDEDISAENKPYVIAAYEKGIIKGYPSGKGFAFDPDGEINIAEACVMLSGLLDIDEPLTKPVFSDSDTIPTWAEDAIYTVYEAGFVNIVGGKVNPYGALTRGDTAEIIAGVYLYRAK